MKSKKEGMYAHEAQALVSAVSELSNNPMSLKTAVRINRVSSALSEFVEPLEKSTSELFTKIADGDSEISRGSAKFAEYQIALEPILMEVIDIDFPDPVCLSELEGISLSPRSLGLLIDKNILKDDVI